MNIEGYGIRLERLKYEHIELVREKRNSPEISQFMEYREFISPEMQEKWFNSLNPYSDFYFVINAGGKQVGLIHTSDVHWQDKTANSGLFIWEKSLLGSHVPVLASLTMLDIFFEICGIESYYAKVLYSNKAALKYNFRLGFEEVPGQKVSKFKTLILTRDNYVEKGATIRDTARRLGSAATSIEITEDLYKFLVEKQEITFPEYLLNRPYDIETIS